jgi:[protein-PII] uridylyltransferase
VRLVEWDGLDGAGRPVPGTAIATVTIGYAYAAAYREPSSDGSAFAAPGTSLFTDASTRFPAVLRRRYEVRMGIIDARIHTTQDGMAVDNFLVQDPLGRPFDDSAQLTRLRRAIEDALANRNRLSDRLKAKALPRPRAEAFDINPAAFVDNHASNRFTVVEVNARDRPALLHQLAQALFQSKVTIHSAHVATYGERAVDTFYVTDLTGDKIEAPARVKALERRLVDAAIGEMAAEAA